MVNSSVMSALRRRKLQVRPKLQSKSSDSIINDKIVIASVTESNDQINKVVNEKQIVDGNNEREETIEDSIVKDSNSFNKEVNEDRIEEIQEETSIGESNCTDESNLSESHVQVETKEKAEITKSSKKRPGKPKLPSDKNKMTMKDYLLYNPPSKRLKETATELKDDDKYVENKNDAESDNNKQKEELNEQSAGPRVKVGANGELILDEESLVLKHKKTPNGPAIVENSNGLLTRTTYSSFRRTNKSTSNKPRWDEHETARFYGALTLIGTDFTLMSNLFFKNTRTRQDLRNKYKKEEKAHKVLIDQALCGRGPAIDFDFGDITNDISDEEVEGES